MSAPTDDSSLQQQINNLKNLNAVLLKETTSSRHQIDSLQSALLRSNVAADVASVFFHSHLQDKHDDLLVLNRQLNDLKARLNNDTTAFVREKDALVSQAKQFQDTLDKEKRLRSESQQLLSQKQSQIEKLISDNDFALMKSHESLTVIETLKDKIESVTRDKSEIENLNKVQETKIHALELEVKQLNKHLDNKEELLRLNAVQLEEKVGLVLQNEEQISALLREKNDIEKSFEILTEQKDSVCRVLDQVERELKVKQHDLYEAIRLSDAIEQVKVNCESEIVELRGEVNRLKVSCENLQEENKKLYSQVKEYGSAVDEAVLEKENIKKGFDEEKKRVEELELLIVGTKEAVAKSDAELGLVRSERDKLIEKEKKLEGNVNVLRKENDALQGMLLEARKETENLSAKVQVWCNNSNKALAMLKATAAVVVCQQQNKDKGEEVVVSDEKLVEEEIQSYEQELDAIKKAFKSKDEMVDDMKQQLATLNKSVVEAHKSKSLWTVISSATTIFAAVLAAYVAKGR